MFSYPCRVCGELIEGMRLPPGWTADEVARVRRLEREMPCAACGGVPVSLDFDDD